MSIIDHMVEPDIVMIEIVRHPSSPRVAGGIKAVPETKVIGLREKIQQLLYGSCRVETRTIEIPSENADRLQTAGCGSRPYGVPLQVHCRNSSVCISVLRTWKKAKESLP